MNTYDIYIDGEVVWFTRAESAEAAGQDFDNRWMEVYDWQLRSAINRDDLQDVWCWSPPVVD